MEFNPILGRRIRAIALTDTGALPATSTEAVVVTNGYITLTLTAETEDGTEIVTRKADGTLCVNERMSPSFKRFNVEAEFCGVHPALLSVVSNAEIYEGYTSDPIGFVVPEGTITKTFSLEQWTGLSGALSDVNAGGYFLLPLIQSGVLGDIVTDGENAVTFSVTGAYTKGGNQWGTGPYNVLLDDSTPAKLPTALDPLDHLLVVQTDVKAPINSDGLAAFTPDGA